MVLKTHTNYVYNNDATYEKDGTETAKCDRCDATDTRRKEGTKLVAAPVTYKIIEGAAATYTINADGSAETTLTVAQMLSCSNIPAVPAVASTALQSSLQLQRLHHLPSTAGHQQDA